MYQLQAAIFIPSMVLPAVISNLQNMARCCFLSFFSCSHFQQLNSVTPTPLSLLHLHSSYTVPVRLIFCVHFVMMLEMATVQGQVVQVPRELSLLSFASSRITFIGWVCTSSFLVFHALAFVKSSFHLAAV